MPSDDDEPSPPPTGPMSSLSVEDADGRQQPKGTAKRDALLANEALVQAMWDREGAFESDAVVGGDPDAPRSGGEDKFIVTFPYPYSNGHLHIGHAFSLTKAAFRAQYERHRGRNVLFPFAFHCTGMPIQAAANKLKAEIDEFGCPPQFPEEDPDVRARMEAEMAAAAAAKAAKQQARAPDKKAKGGRTKLVQKSGTGIVRQWNVLARMVPLDDIPPFVDPTHWLRYFPPLGVRHMRRFGAGVDWRRAFITTSINPYYDAFVRWQFNTLRAKGRVLYGKRNNVYSVLDGQVCADHDRSEGEGVGPQEYVLIKLAVLSPNGGQERHGKMRALLEEQGEAGRGVYLVAATLRPETMYGQTNCFVLPTGEYGAYVVDATDEVFVMSARAARGLSCQLFDAEGGRYFTEEFGKIRKLETFSGEELLGLPLRAPNAAYDRVYTLPLLTISMSKGTGIVTSVPSDAPDDYVALRALKDKPEFAEKYGITGDMVDPYDVVPIISIEGYGEASAVHMCEKLGIRSFNDRAKLAQAKDETYLKGFNFGVMTVGPHEGMKVCDAKPVIKGEMIEAGQAVLYYEPESRVTSRTGDECVVAATDQWYLAYGEESWRDAVLKHVLDADRFDAYDPTARDKYEYVVGWLREWACTRQFGLGTRLPWDERWVIESLSDSTIYMAYYTIAHVLQGPDNLEGDVEKSPGGVDPADLTDDVFDYIYRNGPLPADSGVPREALDRMRSEFRYWYPMDLRVSAKDLIPNHLTMALYNHAAIWDDDPSLWPRGYYANGHVLVDAEKMSKSKGNFLMMDETVSRYSADATRFACADAGDSLDDANFSRETADSAVVSLANEEAWIGEALESAASGKLRSGGTDLNFMDEVLRNETSRLIRATADSFESMQFREGLRCGWFEMMLARNEYRSWCQDSGVAMHGDVVRNWAESVVVLICPICPHWSEKMWTEVLGKEGLAVRAPWPEASEEDKLLSREAKFLRDALKNFRGQAGKAKGGWTTANILVSDEYPRWKVEVLEWMRERYDADDDDADDGGAGSGAFPSDFMARLKEWATSDKTRDKKLIKLSMQFASWMKREVEDVGSMAMDINLPFDQGRILGESERYIRAQLGLPELSIVNLGDDAEGEGTSVPERVAQNVTPGRPYLWMH